MDELQRAIDVKYRAAAEEVDRLEADAQASEPAEIQLKAAEEQSLPSFFVVRATANRQ